MPVFQAEKFVVACFLEAVKTTMDQLGRYRMELGQRVRPGSSDLVALYGEIRRLRDYLQRCFGAFPDQVELDLGAQDTGLVVACARRAVEVLDLHLESGTGLQQQEREWLQKKRQVLTDWAVAIAQPPLVDLPLPPLSPVVTPGLKILDGKLHSKLFGVGGTVASAGAAARGAAARPGAPAPTAAPRAPSNPQAAPRQAAPAPAAPRPAASAAPKALSPAQSTVPRGPAAPHAPKPAPAAPVGAVGNALGTLMASPEAEPEEPAAAESAGSDETDDSMWQLKAQASGKTPLIDLRQIRDPRLRSLMTMDLRAFERASEFGDKRLSALHLASILEGALLDHVLPRRGELGLIGSPDSWSLHDVLLSVLGRDVSPQDRGLLFQLLATRNMIRPALQLSQPAIITAQSLERLNDFVTRALRQLGFRSEPDPAQAQPDGDAR